MADSKPYKFGKPVTSHMRRVEYTTEDDPMIYLGRSGLYVPESIYTELGRPTTTVVQVDTANKAMKISADPAGFNVTRPKMVGGVKVYKLFRGSSEGSGLWKQVFKTLPLGLYRPIGGAVFEYAPGTGERFPHRKDRDQYEAAVGKIDVSSIK